MFSWKGFGPLAFGLLAVLAVLTPGRALAWPFYGDEIPNGKFGGGANDTRCWICHNSAHGGYGGCSGGIQLWRHGRLPDI